MKDLLKIANYLEKSGRLKDLSLITYISEKYADGDIISFFENGLEKDFMKSEFGKTLIKKRSKQERAINSDEESETEELLKSLYDGIKKK